MWEAKEMWNRRENQYGEGVGQREYTGRRPEMLGRNQELPRWNEEPVVVVLLEEKY